MAANKNRDLRKPIFFLLLFASVFMLSGGFWYIHGLTSGVPEGKVRMFLNTPFFACFLLLGFFALRFAYQHADSVRCLFGFAGAVGAYVGIEVLFWVCGGK